MKPGHIYFLTNRAYPGLVKVGFTTNPVETRMSQLNSTGVPFPFDLAACFAVKNAHACEQQVHEVLADRRASRDREFFSGGVVEILEAAFPVVARHIGDGQTDGGGLTGNEVRVLQILSGFTRGAGYSTSHVANQVLSGASADAHPVQRQRALTEAAAILKRLRSMLYVSNPFDEDHWRITDKGLSLVNGLSGVLTK